MSSGIVGFLYFLRITTSLQQWEWSTSERCMVMLWYCREHVCCCMTWQNWNVAHSACISWLQWSHTWIKTFVKVRGWKATETPAPSKSWAIGSDRKPLESMMTMIWSFNQKLPFDDDSSRCPFTSPYKCKLKKWFSYLGPYILLSTKAKRNIIISIYVALMKIQIMQISC